MTPHAVVTLLARTLPDHGEADVTSLGGGLNAVLFKASTPAGPLSVKIPRRHLSPRQAHAVVQAEMRNLRTVQGSGMTPQLVAEIPPASPCPGGGLVMTWIDGVPLDYDRQSRISHRRIVWSLIIYSKQTLIEIF